MKKWTLLKDRYSSTCTFLFHINHLNHLYSAMLHVTTFSIWRYDMMHKKYTQPCQNKFVCIRSMWHFTSSEFESSSLPDADFSPSVLLWVQTYTVELQILLNLNLAFLHNHFPQNRYPLQLLWCISCIPTLSAVWFTYIDWGTCDVSE